MNTESRQDTASESGRVAERRDDPEPLKHADAERVSTEETEKVPNRDDVDADQAPAPGES